MFRQNCIFFKCLRNSLTGNSTETSDACGGKEKKENPGADNKIPPPEKSGGNNTVDFLQNFHETITVFCNRFH